MPCMDTLPPLWCLGLDNSTLGLGSPALPQTLSAEFLPLCTWNLPACYGRVWVSGSMPGFLPAWVEPYRLDFLWVEHWDFIYRFPGWLHIYLGLWLGGIAIDIYIWVPGRFYIDIWIFCLWSFYRFLYIGL